MRLILNIKRVKNLFKLSLPDRLKGGRIENTVNYLRNIAIDYKQVWIDVRNDSREKPSKSALIVAIATLFGYCAVTNPDELQFTQQLLQSSNDLSTVSVAIRNNASYEHVTQLSRLVNQRVVRHQSLGVLSVLYLDDYSPNCCLYSAQCKYTKPKLTSFLSDRVIDIGFVGEYRLLKRKMIDYDVNSEEWQP